MNDAQIGTDLRRTSWKGWKWLWPGFILLLVIELIPWLIMGDYSFRNINYADPSATGGYVGWDNYRAAFHNSGFGSSLWLTFKMVFICLPIEFLLGLIVALSLTSQEKLKKWFLPIIIIPMIISPTVIGLVGNLNLNPDFGLIGITLKNLGLVKGAILGNYKLAPISIMAIDIWQWTPFVILIFTAGLLSLPKAPFEAASVDGASSWQTFWKVTIPLMKPIFIIGILLRFTDLFKEFDKIFIMTGGGPGSSTEISNIFAYRVNFQFWDLGYGSASVMLLYIVSFLACLLFVNFTTSKDIH
jgi:multiple sugar transport system permease protein